MPPLILGDEAWLEKAAIGVNSQIKFNIINEINDALFRPGSLDLWPVSRLRASENRWGVPSAETGKAMMAYVERAAALSLSGDIDAMVTCPINKKAMQQAGIDFPGHTEFLAEKTGASKIGMMLAGDRLRVVLVTIHVPLRSVPERLTTQAIGDIIVLADQALKERFGLKRPRLGVAGLNPHAGEEGLFGDEEARIIVPAVSKALAAGIDITGPHPPDTVFYHAVSGGFDAVICMYHDQGLIPFKMVHFKDGVNTTLGLPIIRTSVDHGTAYDIAGTGKADPGSLLAAIGMAADQARNQRHGF